ncbi:hypothetical protein QU593_03965 [Rossellomorea marisflavi]|uniref:AAA family ATPase n=1 Tax=Rossellomorea marisflavi TaxID=189381 RepID=UPI0025AEF313|nr:AAA family ATPase [Rossellomorea marisflavi]WJV19648.1 hypothetical protein QU593_03965 [Rossellomorea marisflavi]
MGDTPLFIVTGLSAAGKTKASKELSSSFYVFDMDILVESNDFQKACCQWLQIARYNSMSDKATVLFGSVPSPYNLAECKNYQAFKKVYTVLLHCDQEDRYRRLADRGDIWLEENIWLTIEEAEKNFENAILEQVPIINTSQNSVEEVAKGLYY